MANWQHNVIRQLKAFSNHLGCVPKTNPKFINSVRRLRDKGQIRIIADHEDFLYIILVTENEPPSKQSMINKLQWALGRESVAECIYVVDLMYQHDGISPLWAAFCADVKASTCEKQVLEHIRKFKQDVPRMASAPGPQAVQLDEFFKEHGLTN